MGSSQSRTTQCDPKTIIIILTLGAFAFFVSIKYLWDKLEENSDDFYPDELNKCPPETYSLDNSERVKCISCPRCPSGMEPTPPCGTTLAVKLKGECVPCRTGTYSNLASSDACKTCTDCGSRDNIKPCTTERDAECKECPRFYFEDQRTNTCKHCDFCCGRNPSVHLKCITSKICNITCTHTTSVRGKFTHGIFRRRFSKQNNSSGRVSGLDSQRKEEIRPVISAPKDDDRVTESEDETGEHHIESKSIPYEGLQDIEDAQLPNLELPDTILQDQTSYFPVAQDKVKKNLAENVPDQQKATDQLNHLSMSTTITPILQGKDNQLVGNTLPIQATLATPSPSPQQSPPLISLPLFLSSLTGTLSVCAFLGLMILVVYIVRNGIHKRRGAYKRLQSEDCLDQADAQEDDLGEVPITVEDEPVVQNEEIRKVSEAAKKLQGLNLCHIPQDLENIIIKSLEASHPRKGKNVQYGWQKVGIRAGIPPHDLKFFETEYRRPNGYPSKLLLERLGGAGNTVSDLLNLLEMPTSSSEQPFQ